jgi:hypothetical protein
MLSDLYNKRENFFRDNRITDKVVADLKTEVEDLAWYIKLRSEFESKGDEERVAFLSESQDDPERLHKMMNEYGWVKGQENYNYTVEGLQIYLEQMERLYKSINSTHIKENPESYAA